MSVIAMPEGTTLTLAEWESRLAISRNELQYIVDNRILRLREGGGYVLMLVGIAVFRDRILFGYPKFGAGATFDLSQTLSILCGYFARSNKRTAVVDQYRDPEFGNTSLLREFDVLSGLLKWFATHGVYRRELARASTTGRPHWTRTIAKQQPLVVQGQAVYPSVVAERRHGALNEISSLQMGILIRLLERYGLPVPQVARQAELAIGSIVGAWPLGADERAYYQRRVAREQRDVFRTDALNLLSLLAAALGSRLADGAAGPQVFGTLAFYSVWEDACRVGVGGYETGLSDTLRHPTWYLPGRGRARQSYIHKQIPDLMLVRDECLLIVDAKHYYPFPEERPGGPDVIKQMYYAESMQHAYPSVRLLFLLPQPGAVPPRFLGYATIDGLGRAFPNVEAWGIDPDRLFANYPALSAGHANAIIGTILDHRNAVAKFVGQPPTGVGTQDA